MHWRRKNAGFTLIEVMVVVVIIGMLAGLVGVNIFNRLKKAQVQAAITQIANLGQAIDSFKLDNAFYPSTEQGLEALIDKPASGNIPKNYPQGGYLKQKNVPMDPWNEPYQYLSPGQRNPDSYDLWSKGPDREEGTGDDVGNWSGNEETE